MSPRRSVDATTPACRRHNVFTHQVLFTSGECRSRSRLRLTVLVEPLTHTYAVVSHMHDKDRAADEIGNSVRYAAYSDTCRSHQTAHLSLAARQHKPLVLKTGYSRTSTTAPSSKRSVQGPLHICLKPRSFISTCTHIHLSIAKDNLQFQVGQQLKFASHRRCKFESSTTARLATLQQQPLPLQSHLHRLYAALHTHLHADV